LANLFDTGNVPTTEPATIVAGDLLQWKRTDLGTDYANGSYINAPVDGCEWVKPISVAEEDRLTAAIKRALLAHNEAWSEFCKQPDMAGAYWAVMPPSMTSSVPVIQADSSEARNRTPLAISSAVPRRPMGVLSISNLLTAGLLKRSAVSGVVA
jgi:hypothetical protein